MTIVRKSAVILIPFITITFSCAQQKTNPEKIAGWPDKVKVAAVQTGGYDKWLKIKEGCDPVESVVKYVERAAGDSAQLVVFPEYHLGRISVPGPETQKISRAAAENGIYVIVGCWEVFEDESFSSTALLFDREGDIVGKYYKTHAAVDTYDELPAYSKPPSGKDRQWFIENDPEWIMRKGDDLPVFELDFGRIGILICYDGYFPETYRVLSLKGAEIIVWINGRGGSVQDYYVRTFMEQNLVSMICTNQDYGAGTMLAQYPNKIDAICRHKGEGYITTEFDLKRLRIARKNSRNFQQRRPELYREITKSHPIWEDCKDNTEKRVTVARMNPTATKVLLLKGRIVGSSGWGDDKLGCSVEAHVKPIDSGDSSAFVRKQKDYGNLLIWTYGDYVDDMVQLCDMLGFETEVVS